MILPVADLHADLLWRLETHPYDPLEDAPGEHFDLRKRIPWESLTEKSEQPYKIVAVWTDTVLHQADKRPERGFGGRLYFYGKDGQQPLKVEGRLVVYAFVETGRDPANPKPDRKYVFPPDQVERLFSESELGPSYSVWLPWDGAGGPQLEISLAARFEPKKGALVTCAPGR